MSIDDHRSEFHIDHHADHLELIGAFRFCPSCGNLVLARDDFGATPAMQIERNTLEALQEIRCGKCYLPWTSCPCGIKH